MFVIHIKVHLGKYLKRLDYFYIIYLLKNCKCKQKLSFGHSHLLLKFNHLNLKKIISKYLNFELDL